MRQTIYTLIVDGFSPEITALTVPLMERYAAKIDARFHVIAERRFPAMPVCYEKFQVRELACASGDEWSLFLDADVLVHPDLPDLSAFTPPHTVTFNAVDYGPVRFAPNDWSRRDGRHLAPGSWLVGGSRSVWSDLWAPLTESVEDAVSHITPTMQEQRSGITPTHLLDDYQLSRNIARYGLPVKTVMDLAAADPRLSGSEFFYHQYLIPPEIKEIQIRATLDRWGLGG